MMESSDKHTTNSSLTKLRWSQDRKRRRRRRGGIERRKKRIVRKYMSMSSAEKRKLRAFRRSRIKKMLVEEMQSEIDENLGPIHAMIANIPEHELKERGKVSVRRDGAEALCAVFMRRLHDFMEGSAGIDYPGTGKMPTKSFKKGISADTLHRLIKASAKSEEERECADETAISMGIQEEE
jgi:hypothetical protein